MAPPTIAKHKIPEPWLVCLPNPLIAKLKIVGNIIELKSPTAKMDHIETKPVVDMEMMIKVMANIAKRLNMRFGLYTLVR